MPRPNYEHVLSEDIVLPFDTKPFLRLAFEDTVLKNFQVIVVEDSIPSAFSNKRLTTIVARFPRAVLAEVNTHRVFGRNSASSRARSVLSTLKEVMENPYIPVWTINKAGMSGEYASEKVAAEATRLHLLGRDKAVATVLSLLVGGEIFDGRTDTEIANDYENILNYYYSDVYSKAGDESDKGLSLHKQSVNRGLEPYMFHEAIITSSYWYNFLQLRDDEKAADPAIFALAILIREALKKSNPEVRNLHLPFIPSDARPTNESSLENLRPVLLLSGTECAQISYRDKSSAEKSTATTALGERLLGMMHLSPFEHQAFAADFFFNEVSPGSNPELFKSNLDPEWVQSRPVLAGITK